VADEPSKPLGAQKPSRESPRAPAAPADPRLAPVILALRSSGVTDPAVLTAIEKIPRDLFVPELFKARAWEDSALPIACGQTISQPLIVGLMTQALSLESRHRVLEIGTGSGYQTAVLARLARYVYSVERYRTLLGEAEKRLKTLGFQNVITRFGDGGEGWADQAPFDRIIVTAAAPEEPTALLAQLKPKGVLVAPVGRGAVQTLRRYVGDGKGEFRLESLGEVRFVPLLPGVAKEGVGKEGGAV
jgi:protein-L-isoaspartate(D-aspartate) O-methyltransferase